MRSCRCPYYGAGGIPQAWLGVLAERDLITDLADRLVAEQTLEVAMRGSPAGGELERDGGCGASRRQLVDRTTTETATSTTRTRPPAHAAT